MSRNLIAIFAGFVLASSLAAQTPAKKPAAAPTAKRTTPKPSLLDPASLNAKAPEVCRMKFTTTKGDFVVEVHRAWAPLGADRFYNLVKNGFYTDAAFFRVLPGFVAQVGIAARPEVSRVWAQARIPDDQVKESNLRGSVTFATAGPNSRTTQIFINLGDNAGLDGMGFAPFGKVVEGMEVVEQLYGGYGEGPPRGRGPEQGRITNEGKAYLDKDFPQLDSIKSAAVLPDATPPPQKPAATKPVAAPKETQ
jgi:peptidyl-prolyl cis-trans isomerase A (cyclophilin A)